MAHPTETTSEAPRIGSRPWLKHTYYVSDLKPRDRGDWGYTTDPSRALALTPYWQRRFAADCRAVGCQARFFPARSRPM